MSKKKTEASEPIEQCMPAVNQGDVVLFYEGGDKSSAPSMALVTNVGERAIGLSVVAPMCADLLNRDGVKHHSDPTRTPHTDQDQGTWDYTRSALRYHRLEEVVRTITAELGRTDLLVNLFDG